MERRLHSEKANEEWDAFNQTGGLQEDAQNAQEKERLLQLQASQQKDLAAAESALTGISELEDDLSMDLNLTKKKVQPSIKERTTRN